MSCCRLSSKDSRHCAHYRNCAGGVRNQPFHFPTNLVETGQSLKSPTIEPIEPDPPDSTLLSTQETSQRLATAGRNSSIEHGPATTIPVSQVRSPRCSS